MSRRVSALLAAACVVRLALAQELPAVGVGRSIAAIVDELRAAGVPLAYSSAILPQALTVRAVPQSADTIELVREILAPHGLTLRLVEGLYIVVRAEASPAAAAASSVTIAVRDAATGALIASPTLESASTGLAVEALRDGRLRLSGAAERRYGITVEAEGFAPQRISLRVAAEPRELDVALVPLPAEVPEVVVTASRYELVRDAATAPFYLDQRAIEQQPDFGDDPLRALHRLPGAATGVSAKTHLRGAELNETAVVLNGQRLLDPFHIRDYQSMFSAIDARAVDGMQVYTGGFPVRYGDSMGALVLIDALDPHEPRHSELGFSVLNTSVLSAGTIGDGTGNWLVSGRRSNLEDVVHERLGEPSYYDFFGELGVNFSPRTQVSVNVLTARDDVLLVTEADPTEHEQSRNDTRNNAFWVHWQQQWSNGMTSSTTFSSSAFDSTRQAEANDPETLVATVTDRRDVSIAGVRQDWQLDLGDRHALSFGAEYQRQHADYDYAAAAEYFGFYLTFPGVPPTLRRSAALAASGDFAGVYVADRWQVTGATTAELGLRIDRYRYSGIPDEQHLSPRISVRHELGERTALRWSLGRYFQPQGLHELQVEDGVTDLYPAQRAEHAVIGVEHRLGERYLLRAEAYRKSLARLRARYENLFDPLAILPELEPDRVRIAPSEASARGVELSVLYAEPDRGLRWWASYVRARATDLVNAETVRRSWDQRHAAQLGIGRDLGTWDLSAALGYHSGWPTTGLTLEQSPAGETTSVIGLRNALELGSFASVDLRASRTLTLRVGSLDVFIEVSNATNRQNPCCVD
ncbi:MAG TPA: TonB-dependent receptor, partial [Gammaproteobacteria bacterium]|nr:TonB-dependent receptor [Gammaproteobacteria bacterium]